jgi:hypothetical protein
VATEAAARVRPEAARKSRRLGRDEDMLGGEVRQADAVS